MDGRRIKFLVLGGIVVLSMVGLIAVAVTQSGGMHYYYTVGEFLDMQRADTEGFRVNGQVVYQGQAPTLQYSGKLIRK